MACLGLLALGHAATGAQAALPAIIPWPQTLAAGTGHVELAAGGRVVAEDAGLAPLAAVLTGEIYRVTALNLAAATGGAANTNDIVLRLTNSVAADEGYRLTVGAAGILVEGRTYAGVARGAASLLQSIECDGANPPRVPHLAVADEPAAPYRGLLIDVARQWHPVEAMRPLVDMCRLYKIRYMQLHLNDQQSTVFPFLAYPQLASTVSGQRRTWTRDEVTNLVRYADERGVTLVPELEGPGHHAGNLRTLWGRGSTLDIYNENTYTGLTVLVGELCDVFASSPYIHIGADEGSFGHLGDSAEEQAYMAAHGITGNPLGHYITRVDQIVKARGRRTICWEGFGGGGGGSGVAPLPRDILVMPFESAYNPPNQLVGNGFSVINTAWKPLYVVGSKKWPAEYIYGSWNMWLWEHHINTNLHIQLPIGSTNVLGAQMCAWEQTADVELPSTRERIHAMGERTWSPFATNTYADFALRAEKTDALLDRVLALIDVEADGVSEVDERGGGYGIFLTNLTVRLGAPAIGSIHYTTDGSAPTASSPLYAGPFTLAGTNAHYEQLFYNKQTGNYGAQGYVINLQARIIGAGGQPIGDMVTRRHYWYQGAEIAVAAAGLSGGTDGEAQKFLDPITVTLTPSGPGVIRYTLNGGEPTAASPAYGGPLTLAASNCVVQGINWIRASARYAKYVPAVILRARLFSDAGAPLPGLTQKAVYWCTDPSLPQPDEQPPAAPTNVTAVAQSSRSILVSWAASTDDVAVVAYDVYRGATKVASPTATSFTDTNLTPLTAYSYTVKARDAAGNASAASAAAGATTLEDIPDTEAPSTPANVTAAARSSHAILVAWSPSTDNVAVAGYRVSRDGSNVAVVVGTNFTDTGLAPSTPYFYTVAAFDAATNVSAESAPAGDSTLDPDVTPPSAPSNVTAAATAYDAVVLAWSASADDRGVSGYEVYRDGDPIGTVTGTNFSDAGLTPETQYAYTIKAFDAEGNFSAASEPALVTTPARPPIVAEESFDYAAGVNLSGQNGGTGWGGPWNVNFSAAYPALVQAGSLGGHVRLARAGNHLQFWNKGNGTTFENLDRSFAETLGDGGQTLWFAMMVALYDAKDAGSWTLTGLATDSGGTNAANLFEVTANTVNSPFKFGSATLFNGDTNYMPHLVVVKLELSGDENAETLTAYPDPNLYTDPATWTAVVRTGLYANGGLMGFAYRGGRNSSTKLGDVYMDEIRIATTLPAAVGQTNLAPDTESPSAPAGVTAVAPASTSALVRWSASTDNVAVAAYDVYRGGTLVGSPASTSFTDTGLSPSTPYSYRLRARDPAGNVSATSDVALVTTPEPEPDTEPPSAPANVTAAALSSSSILLTWEASTDNVGVAAYDVYRGATLVGSPATTSFVDTGLLPSTPYLYAVRARDATGNVSAASAAAEATTQAPDVEPPSAPANVTAAAQSSYSILVTWAASTDNVGVVGYEVYRGVALVGSPATTSYLDTGLSPGTPYTYTVKARDAATNRSAASVPASATTLAPLTLLAEEPFDYQATNLVGFSGGTGWSGGWIVDSHYDYEAGRYEVADGALAAYPGLAASGRYGSFLSGGNGVYYPFAQRNLATPIADDGGEYWLAFQLQAPSYHKDSTYTLVGATTALLRLKTDVTGMDFQFLGGTYHTTGDTNAHLFLIRMQMSGDTNAERAWLYYDPDLSAGPAAWTALRTNSLVMTNALTAFRSDSARAGSTGYRARIDEIRLATTWQAAVGQGGGGNPDADGDGMPDAWEIAYFGSTSNAQGAADYDGDGDGHNNRQEHGAGTDPTNSASVLTCSGLGRPAGAGLVLQWQSVSGKTYAVQLATNLLATGFEATADTNLFAVGGALSRTVTAEQASRGLYRVVVQP